MNSTPSLDFVSRSTPSLDFVPFSKQISYFVIPITFYYNDVLYPATILLPEYGAVMQEDFYWTWCQFCNEVKTRFSFAAADISGPVNFYRCCDYCAGKFGRGYLRRLAREGAMATPYTGPGRQRGKRNKTDRNDQADL